MMLKEKKIELLKKMLRIRIIEETVSNYYAEQEMRTPVHFSIGQEAITVAACEVLQKSDYVFASHRSHAAYLAKGGRLKGLINELYGKTDGINGGRTGSAHISSDEVHMYSGSILGGMIPVAVGAAYGFKMQDKPNISLAFFGDAAAEEGVLFESVNFAVLKRIPVIFICENNQFSTSTHINYRQPAHRKIFEMIRSIGIETFHCDGNNVVEMFGLFSKLVSKSRQEQTPYFVECATYRYREHVGPNFDFENPYRTKEDVEEWMQKCPIKKLSNDLIEQNIITPDELAELNEKYKNDVEENINSAKREKWPETITVLDHVW